MSGAASDWFPKKAGSGLSDVLRYSQVSFFVDAEEYYADLRHEVTNAGEQRRNGLVCWIGFDASGNTPMPATPARPVLKPFARRDPLPDDRMWLDVLASASLQGTYVQGVKPSSVAVSRGQVRRRELLDCREAKRPHEHPCNQ